MSFLSLNTPTALVLSFPANTHTHTHRFAFIPSIRLSRPLEKLQISKGLGEVQKWTNLHVKSVDSGDTASDLSSGWHYHHQRSDVRDNFFLGAEGLNYTRSPWHTRRQQLLCGRVALWTTPESFFSGSQWIINLIKRRFPPSLPITLSPPPSASLFTRPILPPWSLALLCSRPSTAGSLEGMEMKAY